MARLHIHPVGLFLLFFGLLSWVVALGGLAAATNFCLKQPRPNDAPKSFCADTYQLNWWSIWFEFILLLIMLLTCFTTAFERARQIYLTYLAMVTVLLTLTAKDFITNSFIAAGHTLNDYQGDAYNAAAAGAVLLCITNFALIIFVGLGAAGTPLGTGPGSNPPLSLQMGSSAPSAMEQKYAPSQYQPSNF